MKNLFHKQEELEQNKRSDFENFAFKNITDLLDQNELNMIRGGEGEDDSIIDWK